MRGATLQPNREVRLIVRRAVIDTIAALAEDPSMVDPALGTVRSTEDLLALAKGREADAAKALLAVAHLRSLAAERIAVAPEQPEHLYSKGWSGSPTPPPPTGMSMKDALPGEENL